MTEEDNKLNLAVIARDIEYIKDEVRIIHEKLEGNYVTQLEFKPVRMIVYGMCAILLTGVIGAIIKLVLIP